MISVIDDGGYVKGMIDQLLELEAHQHELEARLAAAPVAVPDVHPNVADIYRRKVEQLAVALDNPGRREEATAAIRWLIERILLTPGVTWAETDVKLVGDRGTILDCTGARDRRHHVGAQVPELPVSVVAGAQSGPSSAQPSGLAIPDDGEAQPISERLSARWPWTLRLPLRTVGRQTRRTSRELAFLVLKGSGGPFLYPLHRDRSHRPLAS